jgi:hypothetical protein
MKNNGNKKMEKLIIQFKNKNYYLDRIVDEMN